ncbi:hypothetical protein BDQ17DRAFT_1435143 [Cyathus striatus]|nr:hypothetical protein BDQ17DRAFT_1435143 [Cyathus striatus]
MAIYHNQNRLFLVVEQLLSLPQGEAFFALNDLHSLIDLNVGSESSYSNYLKIQFHHKSFHDFLMEKERSKGFHIDLQAAHANIAHSCLKFLIQPRYETVEEHVGWLYAFFRVHNHFYSHNRYVEIPKTFQPLKKFFSATQQYSNRLQLQDAIKILGLTKDQDTQSLVDLIEALVNNCSPSVKVLKSLHDDLWLRFYEIRQNIDSFRQLLALQVIVPLTYLGISHRLYDMLGTIHDRKSFREILFNINFLYDMGYQKSLSIFLSTRQFSSNFHCTPDDYADAYITIIGISLDPEYLWMSMDTLKIWAKSLLNLKQHSTPALLAALQSAAQDFYDNDSLNKMLMHEAEYHEEHLKVMF